MRVGISIRTGREENVWNGGLIQNIYHLATALTNIPFVAEVVLINCGTHDAHPAGVVEANERLSLVNLNDAAEFLDVAIEMGGCFDAQWVARLRARGGKLVHFVRDQPYKTLVDSSIFKCDGYAGEAKLYDEIWFLPKDRLFLKMLEAIHRCPAHETPYLWSPCFLEHSSRNLPAGSKPFGYVPSALDCGPIRAAIFEPNLSPTRMGLIPALICEEMERLFPRSISSLDFLNGDHMASQASFVFFMKNLSLHASGKITIHARDYFAHVMARGSNVVVSHQIDCEQNYIYLDALYGGYPLIHNSPFFETLGYYYPGSDISAGVRALADAARHHDRHLKSYIRRSRERLGDYSPDARTNLDIIARRLIGLMCSARRGA